MKRRAITIVELLVVLVIIANLLALVFAAVSSARETARATLCKNNLKQLGLAALLHHDTYSHFPAGGWGNQWLGDPDRGYDNDQPGGWIYNLLPFIEEGKVRDLGRGEISENKRKLLNRVVMTPIPILNCPSRRPSYTYPCRSFAYRNADEITLAAKSDYAINGGDTKIYAGHGGPDSMSQADVEHYEWPDGKKTNGISFVRTLVNLRDVVDGASATYLIGEKLVPSDHYDSIISGDDQCMYIGDDSDIRRWAMKSPLSDHLLEGSKNEFGSAHQSGCQFVYCDGAVRTIAFEIDPEIHRHFGNRKDGQ